jgi:putative methionine-R-sulfoxide reductase with GAF domain
VTTEPPLRDPVDALIQLAADAAPALRLPSAEQLLDSLCALIRAVFSAAAASIAVVDENASELIYRSAAGEGADHVHGMRLPIGRGIAGYVASSGQAVSVAEVRNDPRFAADVAETTGYLPDAIVAVPITEPDGAVVGVLSTLDPAHVEGAAALSSLEMASACAAAAAHALQVAGAVEDFGGVVIRALADSAASAGGDGDAIAALRRRARQRGDPDSDVAAVAARLGELRSLGPGPAATAARILDELLAFARSTRRTRR